MQPRKRPGIRSPRLTAAAAAVAAALVGTTVGAADIDTAWVGRASSLSWTSAANWDQVLVPNGPISVARFNENSGGAVVDLSNASIQLSLIALTDPLFTGITGNGTINLTSAATIFADGGNFDLPEKVYQTFGSYEVGAVRPGNNFAISLVGSTGLTKLGDSHIQLDAANFYTGGTTVGGGKIISTVGDAAFGNAAGSITLSNGSIQISSTDWFTTRDIVAGAGVGSQTSSASIYWVGTGRKADFFGDVSGVGTLELNGFYGTNVGSAVFHAANTYNGTLNISGGTVALRDNGAFANISTYAVGTSGFQQNAIINRGTLVLDNSNSGLSIDRIGNNTPIIMRGSALTIVGGATPYGENIGSLVMDGGASYITVLPGTGGASVSFANLDRRDFYSTITGDSIFFGSGLVFRGTNLGATPGPGVSNIYLQSGTLLLQNGIIPFAWGNANYTLASSPESPDNTLMSYDAINGVKPVVSYLSDFTTSTNSSNVRVTTNQNVGSTTVNANAIVLAAPGTAIFSAGQGMTLSGAGTIHVQSGVVLSASSGNTATLGAINSLPGNVISVNLNFGSNLAEILTPAAITISGAISGTGGLAKIGPRTAVFSGGNTYTGKTYLTGFTRFVGNVWDDGFTANPFGLSTTPIVVYGGNATAFNPDTNAASGTGFAQLGSDSPGNTNFNRDLQLRGDRVMLRSFGNGTVLWNGDINILDPETVLTFLSSKATAHQVVNGSISGSGQVIIGSSDASDPLSPTWVDLMNDGSFSGGLVLAGGTIGIGNDNALGHFIQSNGSIQTNVFGSVKVSGNTLMTAIGGSRIIQNPFVIYGNTLGIGGSNSITLAGSIEGRGGDYVANITSSVPALISGTLTGGGLVKTGSGTLILTGNNNFTGVMSVGNGTLQGGILLVKSPTAFGSTVGPTGVDYGTFSGGTAGQQNQIILDSTGTAGFDFPDESLYLKGFGVSNTGALRNLVGENTWAGTVRISPTYRDAGTANPQLVAQTAAIGVDPSTSITFSTLTLKNGILADDDTGVKNNLGTTLFLANSISLRKVGGGALIVGSQPLSSGTNTWNAAINLTGTLEIQAGTVKIQPDSGVGTIQGGRSVVSVSTLNLAGSVAAPVGKLDLTDNGLIVNYTGTSPINTIRQYLRAGYGSGTMTVFTGATGGIFSSTVTPEIFLEGKTTLGYADTASLPISNLFGHAVDGTSVIVKPAYAGDSNLDGKVDNVDLAAVALNWQALSNRVWTTGDFNFDGAVNINDLALLAMNWQIGVANPMPSTAFASLVASFNLPQVAVPEPVGMGTGALVFSGLLAMRRKRPAKLPGFTSVQ